MTASTPAMTDDITQLDALPLSEAIHARQVSCREVMQAYLKRIHAVNPRYNAIVSLQDDAELLAQANVRDVQLARGESMGWMHGLPQAIKDLSNAAGIPNTLGSPLMRYFVPKADNLMVSRMKAAGCIVVGKTNVPEFGLGSHTFNEVFGATRNAYNPAKSAGGSSGGAGVALALRLLPVADGSDNMGSLRNPAAWANVFGFRPSPGRVPMWPAVDAFINQMGTEGPMGRSVKDVAALLQTQSGYTQKAPLSIAANGLFTGEFGQFDPQKASIGWLGDLQGHLAMEPGILPVCEQALKRLEGLGCAVDPIALGVAAEPVWKAALTLRFAGNHSRFTPYLNQAGGRAQMKPEALWECEQAEGISAVQLMAASAQRTAFYHHMLGLLERHDVLALPTAQVWPFDVALRWPQQVNNREMDCYLRWMEVVHFATFAGLPCISVPAGFNADGLPMGLQLIGQPQGELALLQVAYAYEQAAQDVVGVRPELR